jgi:hypothetical protein
LTIVVVVF